MDDVDPLAVPDQVPVALAKRQAVDTLSLTAEQVQVSKRKTVTGRIDVRTITDTVDEVVKSTVYGQTVDVTHVPIDRYVDEAPPVRTEGDVTIVPVIEEVLVVVKRLLLKEEVHIRRTGRHEEIETTVPLRRQRAVVERHDAGNTSVEQSPLQADIRETRT